MVEFPLGEGQEQVVSSSDIAYLAGFIDGEGCISITRRASNRRSGYTLTVSATQVIREPLDLLHYYFGGSVKQYAPKAVNHRPYYLWTVSSNKAVKALIKLLPYLRVKHSQALLGMEFSKTITHLNKDTIDGRYPRLSDEIINKREELYHQMRELKW